jgi:hypothetical protein
VSRSARSRSRPLTKTLFASGLQCAKRLYLDYHEPDAVPESEPQRQALAEVGLSLIEHARKAFPSGRLIGEKNIDLAVEQTAAALAGTKDVVLFDAAFRHDLLEVRVDILVGSRSGVDLFEVKSGIKVKPRHVRDVAFQVLVIEAAGHPVKSASVLHLNGQYRHGGGAEYPVHELFKHLDVTDRVRRMLPKIAESVAAFRRAIEDPATLDLPTGTFCSRPFPCGYLPRCRAEGPAHPLIDLPELGTEQEFAWHAKGIDSVTALTEDEPGLTAVQRRALRSMREKGLVVEDLVTAELAELEFPLHFVECFAGLHVLPRFAGARPWHRVPFGWCEHRLHADGRTEVHAHIADGKSDPRSKFVVTLADAVAGPGTLVCFGHDAEEQLRVLLEELPDDKPRIRMLLNMPILEFHHLIHAGVYHPDLRGSFELDALANALGIEPLPAEAEIRTPAQAAHALDRLLNPRTRATTRSKLRDQVAALGSWRTGVMLAIYRRLAREPRD